MDCFEFWFTITSGIVSIPYNPTPESDKLILDFLITYLVVRGFSLDSLRNFTMYDFINEKWCLTQSETRLMRFYFHYIRKDDKAQHTILVHSPCGQYVYLSDIFFVSPTGAVSVNEDMQSDFKNENFPKALSSYEQPRSGRPRPCRRRARIMSVTDIRNSSKKTEVYEKCFLQQWTGIDVLENCPGGRGRGIIAAKKFVKNEIVVDYHAQRISREEATAIEADPTDARFNYLFCGPNGLFWDGSPEFCTCHPQSRLLGRLANFARKGSDECNMKPHLFEFQAETVFYTIILVATREIEIEEELRFDYGDKACLALFK